MRLYNVHTKQRFESEDPIEIANALEYDHVPSVTEILAIVNNPIINTITINNIRPIKIFIIIFI